MNALIKLFKRIFFKKKDKLQQIEAPKIEKIISNDFKESIKVKMVDADKFDNIEILKCVGNGSGISDTIKF